MAAIKGKGIPVANPFACLKTEEELAEERKARRKLEHQSQQTHSNKNDNQKRSNKPKKTSEKERLQQLAFGFAKPGSATPEPPKPASAGKKSGKNRNNNKKNQEEDWQQWKEHDQEVVEDQFREDLEKALMESQVEKKKIEEKQKKERMNSGNEGSAGQGEEGKKKKKKDKAKTMSLEEFNNLQNPKPQKSEDSPDAEASRPPIHHRVPSADKDSKFFNSAQHEAKQILKKDKMQEEYRKTFAADNVVVAKLKNDIEIRDKTIKDLKLKMEKMENEMKQVKQRNKQLCVILAQGEMKDKAQVLLQVDELNTVKDELMEQVTTLTAELEKEKSKNSALKPDVDKAKGGKHGK